MNKFYFLRRKSNYLKMSNVIFLGEIYAGNGNDQNFQGGGGILPEVSNFDRKSCFLALLSHN